MDSHDRAIGRLEGELKALRGEFKTHLQFERVAHAKIDLDNVMTHKKLDNLNAWKGKLITGALILVILTSASTEPTSKLIAMAVKAILH